MQTWGRGGAAVEGLSGFGAGVGCGCWVRRLRGYAEGLEGMLVGMEGGVRKGRSRRYHFGSGLKCEMRASGKVTQGEGDRTLEWTSRFASVMITATRRFDLGVLMKE